MRGIVLALILLPVALPAAAQTTLGVRAGLGSAKLVLSGDVFFTPCAPNVACPGFATGSARSLTFGADLGVPLSGPADGLELRLGGAYAVKGGAATGRDANGGPLNGELSMNYLQLSSLLRARTPGRVSLNALFGPWVAIRLRCDQEGQVAESCDDIGGSIPDVGFAVGGGAEIALSSRLSLGVDAIYYRGLTELSGVGETTRFVAIQSGLVFLIG